MSKEEWRPIIDFEGLYEVSNLGRVRSLDRVTPDGRKIRGVLMKTRINHRGYEYLVLSKNNITKTITVHRLVALSFIPNPQGLPSVNHIDEVKTNNRVDNLEWVTDKENANYGTRTLRIQSARTRSGARWNQNKKSIFQIGTDGQVIATFSSVKEAAEKCSISASNISACLTGHSRQKTAGGYRWSYATE